MARWHKLVLGAVEPNPFYEPGNLVPAAAHLPGGPELELVVVEDGTKMLAALPVRRLLSLGGLRVLTSRPFQVINLGTPLLARGAPDGTMDLLLSVVAAQDGVAALTLEWLGDDGPVSTELRCAARRLGMPCRRYRQWRRPVLRRELAAGCTQRTCGTCKTCVLLTPKRTKALARWHRGLARQLGGEPEIRDRGSDAEWVDHFLSLETAGWKGKLSPGSGDLAHRPGHEDWFRESAMSLTRAGAAHLFSLDVGQRVLAMFYVLTTPGRGMFAYSMSYDEGLRAYAPGVQLLLETARFFFQDTDEPFYDSCTVPENTHFPEFFHGSRPICNMVIGVGHGPSRLAVASASSLAPVLSRVRRGAQRVRPIWTVS